jgi:hypothetical protein
MSVLAIGGIVHRFSILNFGFEPLLLNARSVERSGVPARLRRLRGIFEVVLADPW